MSARHGDFAREIQTIGDACAGVLSRIYEVVQAQQRSVLDLASCGGGHQAAIGGKERALALMSALSSGSAASANATAVNAAAVNAAPVSAAPVNVASVSEAAPPAEGESAAPAKAAAEGAQAAPDATAEEILKLGVETAHALADAASGVALAGLQQVVVHAIGLATYNVVAQQQHLAILAQAIVTLEASGHAAGARPSVDEVGGAIRSAGDPAPRAAAR